MINGALEKPWAMLPGPKWDTPLQAKTWLIEQRRLLGWSHKDVAKAFFECAVRSDLYIGPGGGALFDRATEKRVARFEREGEHIPHWAYWMPLVIQHAQVPLEDRWEWERENIPEHGDSRRDREEEEYHSRLFELDDNEIALITRFREMDADERDFLRFLAEPKMLRWWMDIVKRAHERGTDLVALLDETLSRSVAGT